MAPLGNEDVRWLDITMNNPYGVVGIERIGNLDSKRQTVSISIGFPAMRCFSVSPSRNSIDDPVRSVGMA